jgi:hypothetical protein
MIPIGLVRDLAPNAFCLHFDGCSIPAVIMHRGLAQYLFYLNRIVLPYLSITTLSASARGDDSFVGAADKDYDRLAERVLNTVLRFLGARVSVPDVTNVPDPVTILEMWLTRGIEEFVLAHEFGHAVLGHNTSLRDLEISLGGQTVQYYERSRTQELDADAWAQDLLAGAFSQTRRDDQADAPPDIVMAAPSVFFLYMNLLEHVADSLGAEVPLTDPISAAIAADGATHPSAETRFKSIFEFNRRFSDWKARQLPRAIEELLVEEVRPRIDGLLQRLASGAT